MCPTCVALSAPSDSLNTNLAIDLTGISTTAGISTATTTSLAMQVHLLSQKYDQDESQASAIIACESGTNALAVNHNKDSIDYSYWQINDKTWSSYFKKKGLDIKDPGDNLIAGFIILKQEGTKPWRYSSKCWQNKVATSILR